MHASGWRGGEEAAAEQVPAHHPNIRKFFYSIQRQNLSPHPLFATVLNETRSRYHGRQKWLQALEINSSVLVWYLPGNAAKTLTSNKAESVWIRDVQHNPLIKSDGESPGTNSFLLVLQTRRRQERDEWMNKRFVYFSSLKCWLQRGYRQREGRSGTSTAVAHGCRVWKRVKERVTEKRKKN